MKPEKSKANNLAALMHHLGWGSGFHLPIANEENEALMKILEEKQKKLNAVQIELEDNTAKVEHLQDNIKEICSQTEQFQKLLAAKRAQKESEHHLLALAMRDKATTIQKNKKLAKEVQELNQFVENKSRDMKRRFANVEELRKWLHKDVEILASYDMDIEDNNLYIQMVEKAAETDSKQREEAKKRMYAVNEALAISQKELQENAGITKSVHIQFDSTCNILRKCHQERKDAVEHWRNTIENLKERDHEMNFLRRRYQKITEKLKAKKAQIVSKQEHLSESRSSAVDYDLQLKQCDRLVSQMREKCDAYMEENKAILDAILTHDTAISTLSNQVKEIEKQISNVNRELDEWRSKAAEKIEEIQKLKIKLQEKKTASSTSEEYVQGFTEIIEQEEKNVKILTQELVKMNKMSHQRENQVKELIKAKERLEWEIDGANSQLARNKARSEKLEAELKKGRIVQYKLELDVLELMTKINGMLDPMPSDAITQEMIKEHHERKVELDKLLAVKEHCETQMSYMISALERILKEVSNFGQDQEQLEKMTVQRNLHIRNVIKQTKMTEEKCNQAKVDLSLLQLQHHRLKQMIQKQKGLAFTLEEKKISIEALMKEKSREIQTYMHFLNTKKRAMANSVSKIKMDLANVKTEIDALKTRYKYAMYSFEKQYGESDAANTDEEERSGLYFMLKMSQECQLLRHEGDLWDQKVKEAEEEIKALENTLALMTNSNSDFKESLLPATDASYEGQFIKSMEAKNMELTRRKKKTTQVLSHLEVILDGKKLEYQNCKNYLASIRECAQERIFELNTLLATLQNQQAKIHRCKVMTNKFLKEMSLQDEILKQNLEKDLKLRACKEKFTFAVSTVERIIVNHPNLKGKILELMNALGMHSLATKVAQSVSTKSARSPFSSGRSTPATTSGRNVFSPKSDAALALQAAELVREIASVQEYNDLSRGPNNLSQQGRSLRHTSSLDSFGDEKLNLRPIEEEKSEGQTEAKCVQFTETVEKTVD